MTLAQNTAVVGLAQALFWGLQHPLQQNFLVDHAGDIFGTMRVAMVSQLVVLPFLLVILFCLNRRSSISRILKAPKYLLYILLSSVLGITSFYLYAFSQNEVNDGAAIAMLIAVSPIAAYVSLALVDEPREKLLKASLVSLFSRDVAFHIFLGIAVIFLIYGWGVFSLSFSVWALPAIFLVPALYNSSYFVTARVFLKRPPAALHGGGKDFYLTMAAASAVVSSILALFFAFSVLVFSGQNRFLVEAAFMSADGRMYIFGAISIGVFSAVTYYWTYFMDNGKETSYWHHFTPIVSVLVAAIFWRNVYDGAKIVAVATLLVLAILFFKRFRRNGL